MKRLLYAVLAIMVAFGLYMPLATPARAATFDISTNTLWTAIAPQPTSGDTVKVASGATLTVNSATAAVGTLNVDGNVVMNAGSILAVADTIILGVTGAFD